MIGTSVRACFCCVLSLVSVPALAEDDVVLRTTLRPESSVVVGQRVVLLVDVLGKDGWAKLKSLPAIEIERAIVYQPPVQATRINETIQGDSFTGSRVEIWIYPQASGTLEIPSVEWRIVNQVFGANVQPEPQNLRSDKLQIQVSASGGPATGMVVAEQFELQQSWSQTAETLRVGDGITRTVTRTVKDVPSLLLEPIQFQSLEGVKLVERQPSSNNKFYRGELTSSRTDSVTYIFTRPGECTLPDIQVDWLKEGDNAVKTELAEGIQASVIDVASELETGDASGSGGIASDVSWVSWSGVFALVVGIATLGIVVWSVRLLGVRHRERILRIVKDYLDREGTLFRSYWRSAGKSPPEQQLRLLYAWSERMFGRDDSLHGWLTHYGGPGAAGLLDRLEQAASRGEPRFADAIHLRNEVGSARRSCLRQRRVRRQASSLPPLR